MSFCLKSQQKRSLVGFTSQSWSRRPFLNSPFLPLLHFLLSISSTYLTSFRYHKNLASDLNHLYEFESFSVSAQVPRVVRERQAGEID